MAIEDKFPAQAMNNVEIDGREYFEEKTEWSSSDVSHQNFRDFPRPPTDGEGIPLYTQVEWYAICEANRLIGIYKDGSKGVASERDGYWAGKQIKEDVRNGQYRGINRGEADQRIDDAINNGSSNEINPWKGRVFGETTVENISTFAQNEMPIGEY
jgi:hypothetical protein